MPMPRARREQPFANQCWIELKLRFARQTRQKLGFVIQEFHAEVQEAVNRIQPFDVTNRVVGWLRDYGIDAVNMDLL